LKLIKTVVIGGNLLKHISLTFALLPIVIASIANAQQNYATVDRVPDGRRVSGWLVDEATLQSPQRSKSLSQWFGARGVSSVSAGPQIIEYSSTRSINTVQYGRAFLKVDRGGPLTFILTGNINDSAVPFTSCDVLVRLSGRDIMHGQIHSNRRGYPERGSTGIGNVTLDPGYYRLEYVIGCPYVLRASYTIAVRGETDASPRSFTQGELFHVLP
jgi:hypothetical protein